jgi:hypothetical protein
MENAQCRECVCRRASKRDETETRALLGRTEILMMHRSVTLAVAGIFALGASTAMAQTRPPTTPVAGIVVTVTDSEVDITKADGTLAAIKLGDKTRYSFVSALKIEDILPNSYVGVGAKTGADGTSTAVEVTVFPESARGVGEGFGPWNQGTTSTMTNGTVSQVVATSGHTLTVTYKGGQQEIMVPDGTPVTTFTLADRSALVVGAQVLVRAIKADDGSLTAGFVSVGKDGYVPKG